MEQHEIDTFVTLAVAQYGRQFKYTQVDDFKAHRWVEEAMKYAYNLGYLRGHERVPYNWEEDDDIPF